MSTELVSDSSQLAESTTITHPPNSNSQPSVTFVQPNNHNRITAHTLATTSDPASSRASAPSSGRSRSNASRSNHHHHHHHRSNRSSRTSTSQHIRAFLSSSSSSSSSNRRSSSVNSSSHHNANNYQNTASTNANSLSFLFSNMKKRERNLLSACCAVFSIAILSVSLVETRWFYLSGGGCNVNYIGVAHFFAPGRLEYQMEISKITKNEIIVYNFILPNGLGNTMLPFLAFFQGGLPRKGRTLYVLP